ncbi:MULTISPECIES: LysR family transcriptional regulator [unclassified Pseudomonas]|uniref:LysR family transcriptional regulator n=1 Tax=unclassified Pseudomonas TaxID=196821 RepID=UPI002B234237|nr:MULTISPECIES: LysR family transcriptional regulator [unclassified Pseudomonas]MEA9977112.1 LysR family transcriptional regulator [Pseudomonas sp. RTS4]MEB0197724.1 LysR family transcriptional regulator [Pseudomonas sp. 5S4]MEB0246840.1 LysR family transcriptional regulator [Pseudomonas sp. 10S5]
MANTLDIDLLRTFHAVVRFGQFLAASTFLNRSPSAVSLHVRRLEDVAGGRLFERDNQTVTLTPLGRRFALHTAELLRMHDQVLDSFSNPVANGRVRLGISEEYAGALLQCTLPSLTTHFPHIELEIETGSSGRLRTRLIRGQLDLALVVEPIGMPSPDDQPAKTFGTTQPVWVAAHQYRIDSTRPVPLALHGRGCPYRAVAIDALAHTQRRWRTVVMSAGVMALELTISAGLAIGIIDRARISDDMRELTIDDGFPDLPLHELKLIKAPGAASAAVEVLTQLISEHFRL